MGSTMIVSSFYPFPKLAFSERNPLISDEKEERVLLQLRVAIATCT